MKLRYPVQNTWSYTSHNAVSLDCVFCLINALVFHFTALHFHQQTFHYKFSNLKPR